MGGPQTPARTDRGGRILLRAIGFVLALLPAATVFVYPRVVGSDPGGAEFASLVLMLSGVCGSFAYAVGFVPRHRLLRWAVGPACAWPAIGVGAALLLWS